MSLTLSFTARTSLTDEDPLIPGIVPRTYCIFSPSALIIWLNPSSSIAIEVRIRFIASSLVIAGLRFGKLGCDINKNTSYDYIILYTYIM
jgi:hypothetical protein